VSEFGTQPTLIAVAARDAQPHARRPDARAGHDALLDRLFQADVRATAGADIADGGEAGLRRPAWTTTRRGAAVGAAL